MDSPWNEIHIEFFISVLHGYIVSRLKDLVKNRVEKALERSKLQDALRYTPPSLQPLHTALPNEIVSKTTSLANQTTELPKIWKTIGNLDYHRYNSSIIRTESWISHRLDPSIPAIAHINTRFIMERRLRQILICSGINLSVCAIYSPQSKTLPIVLEHPRKWRRLELDIDIDMDDNEYPSFLDSFAGVVPYLEEIVVYPFGKHPTPEELQASLVKWETATKLKKAAFTLSLLKPFLLYGSLLSVTILKIFLYPESDLELMQLISDLPSLEELVLYDEDWTNINNGIHVLDSRINGPILCPRLRSIRFDANTLFISHFLPLFKSTNIIELNVNSNSADLFTHDFARAIHEAFPGLAELAIATVSSYICLH